MIPDRVVRKLFKPFIDDPSPSIDDKLRKAKGFNRLSVQAGCAQSLRPPVA
jgi:hypothetical protein